MHPLTAPNLWQSARAMLTELFYLIGSTTIASIARLKRADRARAVAWLDALEIMVRKLLVIEAAALASSVVSRSAPLRGACAAGAARSNLQTTEPHPSPPAQREREANLWFIAASI